VTAAGESIGRRPAAYREPGGPAAADTSAARSWMPVSVVALSAATGVLVVAVAYLAGHLSHAGASWANRMYWFGQLLILTPVAARLLSRRALVASETVTLVVVLTVAEYLVKVCYSPAAFTYADELMHWRTTTDLMQTGKLFTANNLLPISPYYPGLEEVTSALASITGLSVFTSGLIVAGLAHLLFVCVLFVLFRYVSGSHRVAGVALLLYSSESLFSRSIRCSSTRRSPAIPSATVLAVYRLAASQGPAGMVHGRGAVSFRHRGDAPRGQLLLVATLEVITLGALLARDRKLVAWASILALVSAAAFGAWIAFVAPSTVGYLQPVIDGALQNLRALLAGGHSGVPPPASAANGPLENQALSAAAVLSLGALPDRWFESGAGTATSRGWWPWR
jgi:hypothetical protein